VRWSASKQVLEALRRHPTGAGEVRVESAASVLGLAIRIDAQNNAGDLLPVGTVSLGIEQAQVCRQVPLVVAGKNG
jgi:hypothetical protein